jgi:hypothetical protein
MRILISHENSGTVRDAFIARGHNAISCDLLPTDRPGPHCQGSIWDLLDGSRRWDIIIAHPTCTTLCVSGNYKYAKGKPGWPQRVEEAARVQSLWDLCVAHAARVCFENPVGVLATMTNLPRAQFVQPYEYGHDAGKKTGLHLHNLPRLTGTKRIPGRMVDGKERWANQTDSGQNKLGPSADRWKLRSKTYQGIADAMAAQWG